MNNRKALIIIAKYPAKERVMTRLRDVLTDDERLNLYENLLQQSVLKLRSIPGVSTFIAFAPSAAEEYFSRFGIPLLTLLDGDLGMRMLHAFQEVFRKGYRHAALVGVDIPGLSISIINRAFALLCRHDLVFGPAQDGGYYLIGMNRPIKEVFSGVPWSSGQTLQKSLHQAELHGLRTGFTDTLSDIDTAKDLQRSGYTFPERQEHKKSKG